jgi:hypothetical protein
MTRVYIPRPNRKGAALIVVLGMLVLLMGLIVAFLASSGINRSTSASSASLTAVELMTSVAVNSVVGELQVEIQDPTRSTPYEAPNGGQTLYLPTEPEYAVPEIELGGLTAADLVGSGMENLIKVSINGGLAPTDERSRNGRNITPERWNKPLLMERAASDGSDDSPPAEFPVPEWILVARDGSRPATITEARYDQDASNSTSVIGRYAYVVYNQGGLLDANVAGLPTSADDAISGTNIDDPLKYKVSAGYADLTIDEIGLSQNEIDAWIEEWRNEGTLAATNPEEEYFRLNLQNESGFLSATNNSGSTTEFDRMFISRQQLITFFENNLDAVDGNRSKAILDALQYFTTFSRSQGQPTFYQMQGAEQNDTGGNPLPNYHADAPKVASYDVATADGDDYEVPSEFVDGGGNNRVPVGNSAYDNTSSSPGPTDHVINPIFPAITMTGSGTRIDGTTFEPGDPLMKKRFPLDRLVWLTYKGPSANLYADDSNDPVIVELIAEGITAEYLQQGTAANIEKAFGLRWVGPNGNSTDYRIGGHWVYDIHGLTTGSNPINLLYDPDPPTTSPPPDVVSQDREPDFFEILKATVDVGAIGRAHRTFGAGGTNNNAGLGFFDEMRRQAFINHQIIQIGANMIDQVHAENFPTQIVIYDPDPEDDAGGRNRSFWGVVDLPYLYGWRKCAVMTHLPNPVNDYWVQFPKEPTHPKTYPEHGNNRGDAYPDTLARCDVNDHSGAHLAFMVPFLWNPHGVQSTTTNGLTAAQMRSQQLAPTNFRICVTTTNFPEMKVYANSGSLYVPTRGTRLKEFKPGTGGGWDTNVDWDGPYDINPDDADVIENVHTQWEDPTDIAINVDEGIIDFLETNSTALLFDFNYDDTELFRNPVPLLRDNIPGVNLRVTSDNQLASVDMGDIAASIDYSNGIEEVATGDRFFGFYMFRIPATMARAYGNGNPDPDISLIRYTAIDFHPPVTKSYTFSLEYQPPGRSDWVPYKQLTTPIALRNFGDTIGIPYYMAPDASSVNYGDGTYGVRIFYQITGLLKRWQNANHDDPHNAGRRGNYSGDYRFFTDPRTERWGAGFEVWGPYLSDASGNPDENGWFTPTLRPGTEIKTSLHFQHNAKNQYFEDTDDLNDALSGGVYSVSPFIFNHEEFDAQSSKRAWGREQFAHFEHYIPMKDPDGVARRTVGSYVPKDDSNHLLATSTVGMPMATAGADASTSNPDRFNRPIILRRPFRSVAELSYTFTDTPWRQVDFSTPESGYAGLLDVFCIGEDQRTDSLEAGKVDLNTRQMPVLKALLMGGYRDDRADSNQYEIDEPEAETIAQNLIDWTTSADSDKGPLWNLAHLVGRFDPDADLDTPVPDRVRFDGFSSAISTPSATDPGTIIPRLREAPIRVLNQTGQVGTWNLLVDIVVQTGKYPPSAGDLNDFFIEAEKRVWLHLAIDRASGDLIDYEIEVVTE